jgi:hypothetical protein
MDNILHDVRECLLDQDGSCRDINFETPTWPGAFRLVGQLEAQFARVCLGTSTFTEFQDASTAMSRVQRDRGHAQLLFREGNGLLAELQLFVSVEKDGTPFVEITFFPQDVIPVPSLSDAFITWVRDVRKALCSCCSFVRYENASWTFGDIGPNSGVFIVSND